MVDLSTELCGLKLKNPIIAAAGPNTRNFDVVARAVDAECGAVVVRSLHLQTTTQKRPPARGFWHVVLDSRDPMKGQYSFQSTGSKAVRALDSISPGFGGAARCPTLGEWKSIVKEMTGYASTRNCKVIASIGWCGSCLSTDDLWRSEAEAMAEAGVDAVQLHTAPSPATDPGRYIQYDPDRYLARPIKIVKSVVSNIPVIAKLPSDCCDIITAAKIAEEAGADAVTPTGRWMSLIAYQDGDQLKSWRFPGYGGPWTVPILTAQIVRMKHPEKVASYHGLGSAADERFSQKVGIPIVPSGGVRSGLDVISYIAAGAPAVEVCSQILVEGYSCIGRILEEIRSWLDNHRKTVLIQMRDTLKIIDTPPQWVASVDTTLCTGCGRCVEPCLNEAIILAEGVASVNPDRCEGCRTCFYICPNQAISLAEIS